MAILTVLPLAGDPNAADAPAILRHLIEDPVSVVMLVLGKYADGTAVVEIAKIVEVCVGRAEAAMATRRVVHAPDPDVLEAATLADLRKGSKFNVAAAYGLDDAIAKRLRVGEAQDKAEVEGAFLAAEEQ